MIDIESLMEREGKKVLKCDAICVERPQCPDEILQGIKDILANEGGRVQKCIEMDKLSHYEATKSFEGGSLDELISNSQMMKGVYFVPQGASNRANEGIKIEAGTQKTQCDIGLKFNKPHLLGIKRISEDINLSITCIGINVSILHKEYKVIRECCYVQVFLTYDNKGTKIRMCLTDVGLDRVEDVLNGKTNLIREAVNIALDKGQRTYYDFSNANRLLAMAIEKEEW